MELLLIVGAVAVAYVAGRRGWTWAKLIQQTQPPPVIPPGIQARLKQYDFEQRIAGLENHTQQLLRAFGPSLVRAPPIHAPLPTHDDRTAYLKDTIRIAARRYDVKLDRLFVRFTKQQRGTEAGSIHQRPEGFFVDVLERYKDQDHALTIIAAHEIAHYALRLKRLELSDTAENEELTDTLVVLAGYGPLMLQAYHTEFSVTSGDAVSTTSFGMGYLHPAAVAYLTVLQCEFAGLKPEDQISAADPWYAAALSARTSRGSDKGQRNCSLCGSALPAPDPGAMWLARCSLCHIVQGYNRAAF